MPFHPVDRDLDLVALEQRVLQRWDDDDVFAESLRRRADAPPWVFYEGPPTANGKPGLHHVWARSFKDLYPRFQTMRGHYVERKGGWDCHGLPVELEVEKELGFSGKHQIEEYGIAAFNERCRASVHRYVENWSTLTARIGMWLDTAGAYWTLTNEYIESVWWQFSQMWERGLIYEGFKVVPYCGRCGTALSSHEVAQGYTDVTEPSVYVRFPLLDGNDQGDLDLLVWTTTPWTLPSNVAVAVGPDIEYVRVRGREGRRDLVLARSRVSAVLGDDAEVLGTVPVAELIDRHYDRPFDFVALDDATDVSRVVAADFVSDDDGSGIVHLAPAFGEIDREVAEREGLPMLNPVDASARFDESVPRYAGQFVKDTDPALIDELAASGRLERVVEYTHSYPHCWRCRTPLIYWAKPTWFARTSAHRDDLLRENEGIDWHPAHIKHGRFGVWLENNVDWALSRDRFWGTPLPVWRCDQCGHDQCAGSVADLSTRAGQDLAALDLHRPAIDDVTLPCEKCGGDTHRIEAVLDAWFDSGAMPAAQHHYPFENAEHFDQRFPADFICEAIDQTRGWFYSLLAVNTLVFGQSPYRHVVCLAHIVDRDGQKMSKSRGNVIDPWSILDTHGADALRWYFFSQGSPWTNRRIYEEGIAEATRRTLFTLWSTYFFFVTYANLDGWEPEPEQPAPTPTPTPSPSPSHPLDRWARSRLYSTVAEVTNALEGFDTLRGAQAIERLIDDLSNWYVRLSRPRFWKAADPVAHATLHECLRTIALLLAPFCPFVADEMYPNLTRQPDSVRAESVHLADWPLSEPAAIDTTLERQMEAARQLVSLGRAARTEARLKVRQPLHRALVLHPDPSLLTDETIQIIATELNVKHVELVTDLEGLLDYTVTPNFRRLGPKIGSLMPRVREALATIDATEVRHGLEAAGVYELDLGDGNAVRLEPDDVEIRAAAHEELAVAREAGAAVALDVTLDDELRREGLARELVRALNELRRTRDYALSDRIRVELHATGAITDAARRHGEWIAGEVLALDWKVLESPIVEADGDRDHVTTLNFDGEPVVIRMETITADPPR